MNKERKTCIDLLLAYDSTDLQLMGKAAHQSGTKVDRLLTSGRQGRVALDDYVQQATGSYQGIPMSEIARDFAERVIRSGGYVVQLTAERSLPAQPGDPWFDFYRALGAMRMDRAEDIQRGYGVSPVPSPSGRTRPLAQIVYPNAA